MSTSPHIDDVRMHLLATLSALRDTDHPMEPTRARAIAEVAGVLIDTARIEIEFAKATGEQLDSTFLRPPEIAMAAPKWLGGVTQHRLQG